MNTRNWVLMLGAMVSGSACTPPATVGADNGALGTQAGMAGIGEGSAGASGVMGGSSSTGLGGGAGTGPASSAGAGGNVTGSVPLAGAAGASGGPTVGGAAGASAGASMGGSATAGGAAETGGASGVAGAPSAGGTGMGGSDASGPPYGYAARVENTGLDCTVPELADPSALPSIEKFPDPFTKIDGSVISKRSDWHCRRQEIIEQAKKYIYGQRPTPEVVTGTVSDSEITVHVEAEGTSIDFSADVVLPSSGTGPFPALINVGGKGGFGGLALGEDRILEQGIAVIYYDHYALGQEGQAEASRGLDNPGLFYDIYGGDHSAGLLMAWSWGASRLIDVIQAQGGDILDVGGLGVTGCSRNGKGAFAVGLFDERIALTIPQETSTAGVPAYRIVDILNTERTDHNYFGLNWLSNDFEPFVYENNVSNAVKLPIDTHSLMATMAPRGLLVLDNPHQTQFSAPAGHTAAASALEVYRALGVEGNISYHSNVSDTAHCSYKTEYTELLIQSLTKFLKHENADPGLFDVGSGGQGDVDEWKTWETPVLEEDVTLVEVAP